MREPNARRPVPRIASWIVTRVTPEDDRGFVLSDLAEEFRQLSDEAGLRKARWWYRTQAFRAIAPGLRRRLSNRASGAAVDGSRGSLVRRWLGDAGDDVAYGFRRLVRAPLVVLVTVVSLGLGIGATTTVFSITNGLLFRIPAAISNPDEIMALYTEEEGGSFGVTSLPDFESLELNASSLLATAAFRPGIVALGDAASNRRAVIEIVTVGFFDVLGVRPALGRVFAEDETRLGTAEMVTVISHDFWMSEFDGRRSALGSEIQLGGKRFTIVGVGPEGLRSRFAEMKLDAWVPAGLPGGIYHATDSEVTDRADREYGVLARKRPEFSQSEVEAELALLAGRLHEEFGPVWEDDRGRPLQFRVVESNPGFLPPEGRLALGAVALIAMAGTGLILLIACSNVASLFLARAEERRPEMALRAALGAGRFRLARLLLVESGLLALAGGVLGVVLAQIIVGPLSLVQTPMDMPLQFNFGLDFRVLAFALGLSAFACLAFGLLPALVGSRARLVPALNTIRHGQGRRAGSVRVRSLLVVFQVSASLVLLVGAGLMLRSIGYSMNADLGFESDRIAVVSKDLRRVDYTAAEAQTVLRDLAARIQAHPDVASVVLASNMETMFDDLTEADVQPFGYEHGAEESRFIRLNAVDPGYVEMLQMDLVAGRSFTAADSPGAPRVALVNQAFAARYWPDMQPLSLPLTIVQTRSMDNERVPLGEDFTVVGLVRDPETVPGLIAVAPKLWVPMAQLPMQRVIILAEARTEAAAIVPVLRDLVETDRSDLTLIRSQTLDQILAFALTVPRVAGSLMRVGGAFALILAFLGIYGIVSFAAARRSHEMAVRTAMGANTRQVVGGVMRDGVVLTLWGIALGLLVAVPGAVLIRTEVAGVHPLDPVALGVGVGVILVAAGVASLLPARRLSSLDPMALLRED